MRLSCWWACDRGRPVLSDWERWFCELSRLLDLGMLFALALPISLSRLLRELNLLCSFCAACAMISVNDSFIVFFWVRIWLWIWGALHLRRWFKMNQMRFFCDRDLATDHEATQSAYLIFFWLQLQIVRKWKDEEVISYCSNMMKRFGCSHRRIIRCRSKAKLLSALGSQSEQNSKILLSQQLIGPRFSVSPYFFCFSDNR